MGSEIKTITVEELIDYQKDTSALIIDVREKSEIEETGILPGAINIPLAEVKDSLSLSEPEFKKKYGKPNPNKDSVIVFSCRSGKRSMKGAETATSLGYKNVINFGGGWLEWEKHIQNKS